MNLFLLFNKTPEILAKFFSNVGKWFRLKIPIKICIIHNVLAIVCFLWSTCFKDFRTCLLRRSRRRQWATEWKATKIVAWWTLVAISNNPTQHAFLPIIFFSSFTPISVWSWWVFPWFYYNLIYISRKDLIWFGFYWWLLFSRQKKQILDPMEVIYSASMSN